MSLHSGLDLQETRSLCLNPLAVIYFQAAAISTPFPGARLCKALCCYMDYGYKTLGRRGVRKGFESEGVAFIKAQLEGDEEEKYKEVRMAGTGGGWRRPNEQGGRGLGKTREGQCGFSGGSR